MLPRKQISQQQIFISNGQSILNNSSVFSPQITKRSLNNQANQPIYLDSRNGTVFRTSSVGSMETEPTLRKLVTPNNDSERSKQIKIKFKALPQEYRQEDTLISIPKNQMYRNNSQPQIIENKTVAASPFSSMKKSILKQRTHFTVSKVSIPDNLKNVKFRETTETLQVNGNLIKNKISSTQTSKKVIGKSSGYDFALAWKFE